MLPLAVIGGLGWTEILVILLIVIFLFGARRIPEVARSLGEGIRGFRSSVRGEDGDDGSSTDRTEETRKRPS